MRRLRALPVCVLIACTSCAQIPTLSTQQALERMQVASTKLFAADGSQIANLHGEINRDIVPLDKIPKHLRDAVVAIEDERFWTHHGVDVVSIGRAFASNAAAAAQESGQLQGGSTLSQQLVKNIYFAKPERTLRRKVTEARVTYQFERQYPKRTILEMYLNTIYLGRGVYGVETAARSYFRKDVSKLTLAESAFLAGIIRNPATYDVSSKDSKEERTRRQQLGVRRRATVLAKMRELGFISDEQEAGASDDELTLYPRPEEEWRYPYFVDMVLKQLGVLRTCRDCKLDPRFDFLGSTYDERARNVYRGGLRIYTTVDPSVQAAAEEAVDKVLPKHLSRLSAALASVEPKTGYVRAIVGGRDYYPDDCPEDTPAKERSAVCEIAKVNLALGRLGGGSGRQPGSSFKPFVLAAAIQQGVSLRQPYDSSPFTQPIPGSAPWRVGNYEGEGGGSVDVVEGTVHSVNAVYAHLEIEGVGDGKPLQGSARVAEVARKLGIGFETRAEVKARCGSKYGSPGCVPADDIPSIALGAMEVSPLDMASAYSVFANEGIRAQPTSVARITDAKGKVLYEADPVHARVLPQPVALGVTHVLQQVILRGTGVKARLGRPAAGKTGTSQEWRDAWFAGFVPQLTTVVWVGNPIPKPEVESMTPANGYPFKIVGGTFPAMIWQYFMTKALSGVPIQQFSAAPGDLFGPVFATPAPVVQVPDVLGLPSVIGAGILAAAGFKVRETQCLDRSSRPGIVVRQTPPGGVEFPTGAEVTICVSTPGLPFLGATSRPNVEPGRVPAVVGESQARARADIAEAGFRSQVVNECDPSGQTDPGKVWRQSPQAGAVADSGSTVTIWYNGAACGQQE